MARREYKGAATPTTLTSNITNSATSLTITDATGWPTGSFSFVIDPGLAGEEKVLATSRTGTTINITTRGYDNTTAASHLAGAIIYPVPTAIDFDEANVVTSKLVGGTTNQVLKKNSATDNDYSWADPAGDITGVTAGTGITGGGTSGDVTVSFDIANYGGGQYAAGKNKIINGDFGIWQRGTSFGVNVYGADRWLCGGSYASQAQQALAPATISGIDSPYFCQVTTGANSGAGDYGIFEQRIENVATFAGQQITISFYAKATSGTPKIGIELAQYFGSGGSSTVFTAVQAVTISTTWTCYTVTTTVPSVSGKTIGSGSYLGITNWVTAGSTYAARSSNIGNQNAVFGFAGYQIEAGSTATPFQTATGTKQGELAACQRYYYQLANGNSQVIANGGYYSSSLIIGAINLPVTMRSTPSLIQVTGTSYYQLVANSGSDTLNSLSIDTSTNISVNLFNSTDASGTSGAFGQLRTNSASASLALSAEL